MAALTPVLLVTDSPSGLQSSILPVATSSSTGSILNVSHPPPPPPANPTPTATNHTVTGLVNASITWSLNRPEQISYVANGPDITALHPGFAPSGVRMIGISLDGTHHDSRMLSTGAEVVYDQPPYVTESGNGLGVVLATTTIPRFTAQQIYLGDAITAAPGTIKTTSGGTLLTNNTLPDIQGIGRTTIGAQGSVQAKLIAFNFIVDPAIYATTFDIDINEDTIQRTLETICERLGSTTDPQRAQFVIDSGDYGIASTGGSGVNQTVTLGHVGTTPYLTFDGVTTTYVAQMVERGTTGQAQSADMAYSCRFSGGDAHHGMPDGATITAIRTINHGAADATGSYKSGMPVFGMYISKTQGGVYYWPGDEAMHPMSQAFGVNDLWYDETAGALYASTDAGVYTHSASPDDTAQWTRLGGMSLSCDKLCKDNGILYAQVSIVGVAGTSILRYPAAAGSVTGAGIDGWSFIITGDVLDFAVGGGALYYYSSVNPTALWWSDMTNTTSDIQMNLPGSGIYAATGLDAVTTGDLGSTVSGIFVRTSGGSACIQYIVPGAKAMSSANADNTLVDQFGSAVRVNRITQHGAGQIQNSLGSVAAVLFAATNRGMYVSDNAFGGNWKRTDGQSNLGDIELSCIASSPPRTWLGTMLTRIYAITHNALWISNNGGLNWIDAFSRPLTVAPAWYALFKNAYGVYPDNVATGAIGSKTPIYYPNPKTGPFNVYRFLNNLGEFTYTMINPLSQAPAGAHRSAPITQITSSAQVPEIPCSQLLLDAEVRFLNYTAQPQIIVEVDSSFTDSADLLRTLRPTHMVKINAVLEQCLTGSVNMSYTTYSNQLFYVLEHTITISEHEPGVARTKTKCASLLLDSRTDPMRVTADLFYAISREQLYKTRRRS